MYHRKSVPMTVLVQVPEYLSPNTSTGISTTTVEHTGTSKVRVPKIQYSSTAGTCTEYEPWFIPFFHYYCAVYDECKYLDRFGLQIVFVCLYITSHYHQCVNLSEDIELIKCLSDIFCRGVSEIKHILSVIHYTMYGAVCFQFTHSPCDDWENIHFELVS